MGVSGICVKDWAVAAAQDYCKQQISVRWSQLQRQTNTSATQYNSQELDQRKVTIGGREVRAATLHTTKGWNTCMQ